MADLLKLEPKDKSRTKLYRDVEDDQVDPSAQTFTWSWIRKATKIKRKVNFEIHLDKGHFGPWEKLGPNSYKFTEGHRAICRFNNGRHTNQKTMIVTKAQYEDMMAGRPVRDMAIMVRGKLQLKTVSLKRFNHSDFIAVRRYSNDQARALALGRVENAVDEKTVPWHNLPREGEEYRKQFQARMQMFEDLYLEEIVLMAKDTASPSDIRAAADLPASILSLIDYKLSATQAEYYVSRFLAAIEMIPGLTKNPFMAFRIHQVILEEMQVEHYRDLQRLHGDDVDKNTQDALHAAMSRLHKLMPGGLMKSDPPSNGHPTPVAPERLRQGREPVGTDPFI